MAYSNNDYNRFREVGNTCDHHDLENQHAESLGVTTTKSSFVLDNPFADPPQLHIQTQNLRRDSFTSIEIPEDLQIQKPIKETILPKKRSKIPRCCTQKLFWIVTLVVFIMLVLSVVFIVIMTTMKKGMEHKPYRGEANHDVHRLNSTVGDKAWMDLMNDHHVGS
ncbi:hypothetical protein EJ08DRAFT_648232 [Tothia fuscella]|uniref:Uncharacterized protein n=1 Tax=Tothia fuscella TaxID=1048955 RepID=A0A9P4U0H9_9PEZI|nr:hypothetical protein EJ08DRAFT_648232 [Tothia fuscella]